jgi:tetratricopeptide (TPR) repeat protein
MIRGDESPASLGMAKDVLYVATATDPTYDRIYVLQSYVALRMNDVGTAGLALRKAEALHPTDPWFKLNYALYYDSLGQMDKALKMREEVVASGTSNEGALRTAMQDLEHHYMLVGDRPGTDRLYQKLVARWPNEAYVRGNYARSVITQFFDYDAGERAAKEALAIMDYPHARQTVSLALYGRWAAAKRDRKDFTLVRALLDKARAYDPHASMVPTCALESPRFVFLKDALLALEMGFDPTLHNC